MPSRRSVFAIFVATVSLFAAGELSGRRAPGFSLPDSSLKQHDLMDYRGRIVLIDFMMTKCPHCVTFSKVLERVKARYGNKVAILSVVNYSSDNSNTVAAYINANGVTVPMLYDCGQVMASYMQLNSGKANIDLPHLFIIDREGFIRNDYYYGASSQQVFQGDALFSELDRMLAGSGAGTRKSR
jgi:peroxiredoxin